MKTYKLSIHNKGNYNDAELQINPKEFPHLKLGSVVEIYCVDRDFSRLLLQVRCFLDEKEKITASLSVEQSIASAFQLRIYDNVVVNEVDAKKVTLDSVEIVFRDQYLSRSDMWRLKLQLIDSCVYLNKKIEENGIRCSVFEIWSQGDRVASGYIDEDTKVVFRSACSMVYLFIQMSSEMWDYDINGDLYFEKAVNGFLTDLFEKWKKFNCSHDVTIVLFSRTFYDAKFIYEFPQEMRECLQTDYKGRFYEDFYRVAVQNERYDDWSSTLVLLKNLFNSYHDEVLKKHDRHGKNIPKAFNSTSSQGNFLEVLNMSLNVFEKHYLDRSFDRTGQLSVVISPGVGVFEVDLALTNITKQRIIDNGIGSDLVCLGEQPLHAVPLFKFNDKQSAEGNSMSAEIYNMPHWINLSFYSSTKPVSYAGFVPRIKLPNISRKLERTERHRQSLYNPSSRDSTVSNTKISKSILSIIDYDEYDSQVFKTQSQPTSSNYTCQPSTRRKTVLTTSANNRSNDSFHPLDGILNNRRASDALNSFSDHNSSPNEPSKGLLNTTQLQIAKSDAVSIPSPTRLSLSSNSPHSQLSTSVENKSTKEIRHKVESKDDLIIHGNYFVGTGKITSTRPKALINPFDPRHVSIKLTSNRRRWTHVFPLGPTGIFMQQHHYQAVPSQGSTLQPLPISSGTGELTDDLHIINRRLVQKPERKLSPRNTGNFQINGENSRFKMLQRATSALLTADPHTDKSLTWAWGATGEQEWTPAITTGVDWKSLVIPACLPVTTDFLPDKRSLQNDYVMSAYDLIPEDQGAEILMRRCYRADEDASHHSPLTTDQVYQELICQRLQQGFQIIIQPNMNISSVSHSLIGNSKPNQRKNNEYTLSIGRIFHRLVLDNSIITVTQFRPRHPNSPTKIHYCYRFRAPDNENYGVSWIDFISEKLENYNWNYLDNYICLRGGGEGEYELIENLKFWRLRLLLLPNMQIATKKIYEHVNSKSEFCCDIYLDHSLEKHTLQEGFVKFLEIMNKIRRTPLIIKKLPNKLDPKSTDRRLSVSPGQSQNIKSDSQYYRERVGSSNVHDRPRPKTQHKTHLDKVKDEPDGNASSSSPNLSSDLSGSLENLKKLNLSSPLKEVIETLKTSNLLFLKQQGLLQHTFISAEAVNWVIENIDGISDNKSAKSFLQNLLRKGFICHASGDLNHQFYHGFYMYSIMEKGSKIENPDLGMFKNEWMEVEFCDSEKNSGPNYSYVPKFKKTTLEVNSITDRVEWVHVKYQDIYDTTQALEMVLEWMVGTSNKIADIVLAWIRKASTSGLHLVPIPNDPFSLPFSSKSDPLRGPIYITLHLGCLPIQAPEEECLFEFREKILSRFGFVPFYDRHEENKQYVHASGSIFVMIPNSRQVPKRRLPYNQNESTEPVCSPHEDYITRHFSGIKQTVESVKTEIKKSGFLLSWNYMMTKRWKTSATGDEPFSRRVLRDFKEFCSNDKERLRKFWDEYYDSLDST